MVNLVRNAIEAAPEKAQVVIRTESASGGVRVSVEDNGRGMTEEEKGHSFDPFYTTRQAGGGTGLGASIAYGIVRDHEGTMELRSAPGEGTTVTIDLPDVERPARNKKQTQTEE